MLLILFVVKASNPFGPQETINNMDAHEDNHGQNQVEMESENSGTIILSTDTSRTLSKSTIDLDYNLTNGGDNFVSSINENQNVNENSNENLDENNFSTYNRNEISNNDSSLHNNPKFSIVTRSSHGFTNSISSMS